MKIEEFESTVRMGEAGCLEAREIIARLRHPARDPEEGALLYHRAEVNLTDDEPHKLAEATNALIEMQGLLSRDRRRLEIRIKALLRTLPGQLSRELILLGHKTTF